MAVPQQRLLDWFLGLVAVGLLGSLGWWCYVRTRTEALTGASRYQEAAMALHQRQILGNIPKIDEVRTQVDRVVQAREELARVKAEIAPREKELQKERERLEVLIQQEREKGVPNPATRDLLHQVDQKIRLECQARLEGPEKKLANAEAQLKGQTELFDHHARVVSQPPTSWSFPWISGILRQETSLVSTSSAPAWFRENQQNQCVSCHRGIDDPLFERQNLEQLPTLESDEYAKRLRGLKAKLNESIELLQYRGQKEETLGKVLESFPREILTVPLTRGQISQFARHPRPELFVSAESPHPQDRFDCTVCHNGSSTTIDFTRAGHQPTDSRQQKRWQKEHGWHVESGSRQSMLAERFVEASCLKCHHQVTDLIRQGNREDATKLLQGYNLVREQGCFGCHEISGKKGGLEVGPDLRLEPLPALDLRSASERQKMLDDSANPPGTYRKVGPGLRRLSEKTSEEWVRKWLQNPRGFQPDTRMPHFYNLGTNDATALAGSGQELFPAAEIHAIAHYLLSESKGSLTLQEQNRLAWQKTQDRLLREIFAGKAPSEEERKLLRTTQEKLTHLALLTVPTQSSRINAQSEQIRSLQERLLERSIRLQQWKEQKSRLELMDKSALSSQETEQLENVATEIPKAEQLLVQQQGEMDDLLKKFRSEWVPTPIQSRIVSWNGQEPGIEELKPGGGERAGRGRKLFLEKGCVACHVHEVSAREDKVDSGSHFGPSLTRLAAKIASPETTGRRWLIQWLLNPNIHSNRTRMPITQLETAEAVDLADFLLAQKVTDWEEVDPAAPPLETLVRLARVYLARVPGVKASDLDGYLPEKPAGGTNLGIPVEFLQTLPEDSDEWNLQRGQVNERTLKRYIGKKSIARLGCAACHDIPGFEQATPVGAPLTEWGKKDSRKLAFGNGLSYVQSHFNMVSSPKDSRDPAKMNKDWKTVGGKPPMERIFVEALEQGTREGYLNLKLAEPRSFDNNRSIAWDERSRMPQHRFALSRKKSDETDEAFASRQAREEAEAREAVMTFVLGLVGETVPRRLLPNPSPERQAEVKGRQLLEQFNCSSCHLLRPGVFDIKVSPLVQKNLEDKLQTIGLNPDYHFADHNAWVGKPSARSDRLTAHGTYDERKTDDEPVTIDFRLVEALRFKGTDGQQRDLPAGELLSFPETEYLARTSQYGGMLTRLLNAYIRQAYPSEAGDADKARNKLPPPLLREGERVQPNWLYQFLLKPYAIRPSVVLRMPQFNLSPEEVTALVQYFNAVETLTNPDAGRTGSFDRILQQEAGYWQEKTKDYLSKLEQLENSLVAASSLGVASTAEGAWLGAFQSVQATQGKARNLALSRESAFRNVWKEVTQDQLTASRRDLILAREDLKIADEALKKTPEDAPLKESRKRASEQIGAVEARIKLLEDAIAREDYPVLAQEYRTRDAYAADSYRLLLKVEGQQPLCLTCHLLNGKGAGSAPALDHLWDRLRPEWTARWIANPSRMFAYSPLMQQNFKPAKPGELLPLGPLVGTPLDQVEAIRDALMNYAEIHQLPVNRLYVPRPIPVAR